MSKLLQAIARRIRLALHFHDAVECWCELTAADAPPVYRFCANCGEPTGQPHKAWCWRAEVPR